MPKGPGSGIPKGYFERINNNYDYVIGWNLDEEFESIKGFSTLDDAWDFYIYKFDPERQGKILAIKDNNNDKFIWLNIKEKEINI